MRSSASLAVMLLLTPFMGVTAQEQLPAGEQRLTTSSAYSPEHASGGEPMVFGAAIAFAGLVVYDIVTAPSSARRYNESRLGMAPLIDTREKSVGLSVSLALGWTERTRRGPLHRPTIEQAVEGRKSPVAALLWSLGATAIPMLAGVMSVESGREQTGAWLIYAGLALGPSAGHWYAERTVRGFRTAGLRIAISAVAAYFAGCCT